MLNSTSETVHTNRKRREEMKKFAFVLSVLVLASLVLTACGAKTTTTGVGLERQDCPTWAARPSQ